MLSSGYFESEWGSAANMLCILPTVVIMIISIAPVWRRISRAMRTKSVNSLQDDVKAGSAFMESINKCDILTEQDCTGADLSDLRALRESGARESERVIEIWSNNLVGVANLGNETWSVLEQVFIAALDMADDRLACDCLNRLKLKFPKSSRVSRLLGMYLERMGRIEDARGLYAQLMTDDSTNTLVRKRMIAILKAQRKNIEAIDALRQYLNHFMSDFEAWNELADLYLAEGDFKHAAFCMEEMLLSNPHNHLYHQRYAEIKYTEGGNENMEIARTYFSHSCQLNPGNLRSLYGLLLSCSALDNQLRKSAMMSLKGSTAPPIHRSRLEDDEDGDFDTIEEILPPLKSKRQSANSASELSAHGASKPEVNRLLARWAQRRIHHIYSTAFRSGSNARRRKPKPLPCEPVGETLGSHAQ